jgi:small subunit ribosomal protein S4
MSRYRGPRARHVRRLNVNIYGSDKYDRILTKRGYAPGMHGQGRFKKKSDYARLLEEKQKARLMFGLTEKQFRRYYAKAERSSEVTGKQLLRLLEQRLDNVIYRAGFAITRAQARQMVGHGHFKVNGRRVTVPSIHVRVGDKIEIRSQLANSPLYINVKANKDKIKPPSWMSVDFKQLSIEIMNEPADEELEQIIQPNLIVEFYSKA